MIVKRRMIEQDYIFFNLLNQSSVSGTLRQSIVPDTSLRDGSPAYSSDAVWTGEAPPKTYINFF